MPKSGLWMVVDANYLRGTDLESFLGANNSNRAVFTGFTCQEAYKGNPVTNISRSLAIVSKFPEQVVVLKGTRDIVVLQCRKRKTTREDFVDEEQTLGFPRFCFVVRHSLGRDIGFQLEINKIGRKAAENLDQVRRESVHFAKGALEMASSMDPKYVKSLRTAKRLPEEAGPEILARAIELMKNLAKDYPVAIRVPKDKHLPQFFLFRYAFTGILLALRWIADGGIETTKSEKMGNDIIDMSHAVHATYFDGFLTYEQKWMKLYKETRLHLSSMETPS